MDQKTPPPPRTAVFVDGQNLFRAAKEAFGYDYPNYDIAKLAKVACGHFGWSCTSINFYTGIPSQEVEPNLHQFWTSKLSGMGRQGISVIARPLRYRQHTVELGDGLSVTRMVAAEKGIDVRLALDLIRMVNRQEFDAACIFSQDQDLSEATEEAKFIAKSQGRLVKLASAFPDSAKRTNRRGINGTQWLAFNRQAYDLCIDPKDYRPRVPQQGDARQGKLDFATKS